MWEMLEDINFECDDCGGPGPPPKFMIPPPPRPPFMQELIKCKEDDYGSSISSSSSGGGSNSISKSGTSSSTNSDINYINNWDSDICDAIPILDASYHSSPSLQTSAIIAVFSLLLVLVVLVSSLFVWKHKRKVQNFLPCKTPTRGPHIGGNIAGGHSVTYEDPDAHLGHRPLVMRHHNVEIMNHSKSIHYPSGFPMTRSPPLFVCSSPGPDPYRSNDNVYEELGPTRDSDIESEPDGQQSDDDFAEDELSLPGERSFNKTSPPDQLLQSSQPVSTIYHERSPSTNLHERNTLLTTSVHSEPNRLLKNNRNIAATTTNGSDNSGGILSGVFRHTTGRNKNLVIPNCKINNRKYQNHNTLPYNIDSGGSILITPDHSTIINHQQQSLDILPSQIYDDPNSRNSLMTLAYNSNSSNSNNINNNGNTTSSNNLNNNSNNNNNNRQSQNCYNKLESEVERRNRINNQLHQPPTIILTKQQPVATIFRGGGDRINYTSRYPQPYYTHHHHDIINNQSQQQQHQNQQFSRSRTNPRSLDRRRIITTIPPPPPPPQQQSSSEQILDESTYGYAEPVFHEGLLYNNHHHHNHNNLHLSTNNSILRQAYPSYILPDYTTGSYRTIASNNNNNNQHNHNHHHHQPYHYPSIYNHQNLIESQQTQQQLYSRDSSFGSDSGYSHNTQGSSLTGDIVGRNCRNINNSSSNGIRTPTTSNLLLPLTTTEIKYHGQQNYNNCTTNNNNNKNSNSNCSNFLWNRKIPPSISSLSSQSTNNSISSSSGCTKDNNLLSQGTNITLTNSISNNSNGAGIIGDDDDGNDEEGIAAVITEPELPTTINNCKNSKNSISNVSSGVQQSQYNSNNNNLNVNNQILSNTSKSNSNNSLGSINNNSNLNCLSGISGGSVGGGGGNSIIVDCISNSTNSKT